MNEQSEVKPQPTHILVSVEIAEKLSEYLQSKPFREVATLLTKLSQCQGVTVQVGPPVVPAQETPPAVVTGAEESPS